jgi:hypothetical protein
MTRSPKTQNEYEPLTEGYQPRAADNPPPPPSGGSSIMWPGARVPSAERPESK